MPFEPAVVYEGSAILSNSWLFKVHLKYVYKAVW